MRVGIDARLLYYQQAGIATYITGLIRGLATMRRDEDFVVLQSRKDEKRVVNCKGFEVAQLWTPSHNRFEQFSLPIELALLRLNLLHSPDFIPPFHRRCKSVITVHDLAFLRYPHLLTKDSHGYYGQISQAVGSADGIIAVSSHTRNDLIDQLGVPAPKIRVIPEAADPAFQPIEDQRPIEEVRQRYQLPRKFVLFVGTIEPRKNLVTLISAFEKVVRGLERNPLERGSLMKLVIAGREGWLCEDVFAAVSQLGLKEQVMFLGAVPQQDLPALYNAASLLAMPSLYEGFGLPVLEAMACGTPVIASRSSSIPEVAADAAILVDPLDIDGWAEALVGVLGDENLGGALREKGLARARGFSWERMATETLAFYKHVVEGARQ
ncbi:MAG: glycosyltransferase family 1 protein [Dehalococcoidales bacterium]|nr:glycosyltransferase family 1 protein [Dehalococcoidales bacterium]